MTRAKDDRLLTCQEFANLVGISANEVRFAIHAGHLDAWRRRAGKTVRYGIDRDQAPIFLAWTRTQKTEAA